MKKTQKALLALLLAALAFAGGVLVGRALPRSAEVSFYANVVEYNSQTGLVLVEGIPENHINHRGQFYVDISGIKNPVRGGDGRPAAPDSLVPGTPVYVVYDGLAQEVYPAVIVNLYYLRLAD